MHSRAYKLRMWDDLASDVAEEFVTPEPWERSGAAMNRTWYVARPPPAPRACLRCPAPTSGKALYCSRRCQRKGKSRTRPSRACAWKWQRGNGRR